MRQKFQLYVYICMYVCMYVCMYICMYVCMYVWMYVCMYGWMDGCMDIGRCVRTCVCMYVRRYVYTKLCIRYVYICIHVCMCVCVYTYVCVQIYSFAYTVARAVDKNNPHFSIVPEGRQHRDRWKSLQVEEKDKRKQTIFRTRIYRLKPSRLCFVLSVAAPFSVLCLVLELKVRIQFKGFVVSKSVAN